MIFETEDNNFVISSGSVWLPGRYETKRAANYAFRFKHELLDKFQHYINTTNGVISFENL